MLVLTGAQCFDPQPLGVCDVLIAGSQVLDVAAAGLEHPAAQHEDLQGKLLLPGFVDALTHPCGGGGEGGFANRTAEITAEEFLRAGVTAPVGALGTDSLGRSLEVLYGCVMGLRAQGLNAYMYSGAYRCPVPTLTGDVARDVYLVQPVIGMGEVAVADHRGTQPSAAELRRLAAETQLGGILAGEGGTVMVHIGDGDGRLGLLREAIAGSDLPASVLYPTHVNRSAALLDEAAAWTRQGGYVDVTVSTTPELIAAGDIPAAQALRRLLAAGAVPQLITLSSDAGGSLPVYVDGKLQGLTAASPASLPELLAELIQDDPDLFAVALAAMTRNPARALQLKSGGQWGPGSRADLVVMDAATGAVDGVIGAGRWLWRREP